MVRQGIKTSKALERQVARIHELLERSNDAVTWDDRTPDPDNPGQLRQIDVTIRRDGQLTIIECRLSRSRQNVKWIEELMGRRQSLGAQAVIAVASAGFTVGAQKKAARYGILLHDLQKLTDEEIENWGEQTSLLLYYYQYSNVKLAVGFPVQGISSLDTEALSQELRSHPVLQTVFNAVAEQLGRLKLLANNDDRSVSFGLRIPPENVFLCGQPVIEIGIEGNARLVTKTIPLSEVIGYGVPNQDVTQRDVLVERFELGESSIVHNNDRIATEIDLSSVVLPPLSQIRYFRITSASEVEHEVFAITNPGRLRVSGRLTVEFYARE